MWKFLVTITQITTKNLDTCLRGFCHFTLAPFFSGINLSMDIICTYRDVYLTREQHFSSNITDTGKIFSQKMLGRRHVVLFVARKKYDAPSGVIAPQYKRWRGCKVRRIHAGLALL